LANVPFLHDESTEENMFKVKHAKIVSDKIIFYPLGNMKEGAIYFSIGLVIFLFISLLALVADGGGRALIFLGYIAAAFCSILFLFYFFGTLKIVFDRTSGAIFYQLAGIKKNIGHVSTVYDLEVVMHPALKAGKYIFYLNTDKGSKKINLTQEINLPNVHTEQVYNELSKFLSKNHPKKSNVDATCLVFKEKKPGIYEYKYLTYGPLSGCLVILIIPVFAAGLFLSKYLFLLYIPLLLFYPKNRVQIDLNKKEMDVSLCDGSEKHLIDMRMVYKVGSVELKNMKGMYLSYDTFAYMRNGGLLKIIEKPINDNGSAVHDINLLLDKIR